MYFKDLKTNYPVYILDRSNNEVHTGKVTRDATIPHYDLQSGDSQSKFTDVEIEYNGVRKLFAFKENQEIGWNGNLTITPVKEYITREVTAILNQAEEELRKIPQYKESVSKCKKILEDWDPVYKEKKEQDNRLSKIEDTLDKLATAVLELSKKRKTEDEL